MEIVKSTKPWQLQELKIASRKWVRKGHWRAEPDQNMKFYHFTTLSEVKQYYLKFWNSSKIWFHVSFCRNSRFSAHLRGTIRITKGVALMEFQWECFTPHEKPQHQRISPCNKIYNFKQYFRNDFCSTHTQSYKSPIHKWNLQKNSTRLLTNWNWMSKHQQNSQIRYSSLASTQQSMTQFCSFTKRHK